MDKKMRKFDISSVGIYYRKSLELFASRLEDVNGEEIALDQIKVDEPFFVIFPSGTGFTRTSGVRIV